MSSTQRAGMLQVTYLPVGRPLPQSLASPCFAPPYSLCPLTELNLFKAWRESCTHRTIESSYQFLYKGNLVIVLPLLHNFRPDLRTKNPQRLQNSLYANVQTKHSFSATGSR